MIRTSGLVAAALVGLVGFAACGGDKSDPIDSGTGGSTSGSGGSSNGTGGASGSTASGGAQSQGGSVGYECTYTEVPNEQIVDFSVWDAGSREWGDNSCCLTGGSFTYQATGADPLDLTVESEVLNVTGSIAASEYAGFGFWFGPCTDASRFSGVTFNIGGDAGSSQIVLQVQTSRDYPIDDANSKGECVGSWGDPCASNEIDVAIPEGGGVVQVPWADLTGGAPEAMDPTELMGIQWEFDCGDDPCDVAVTLDDVAFY